MVPTLFFYAHFEKFHWENFCVFEGMELHPEERLLSGDCHKPAGKKHIVVWADEDDRMYAVSSPILAQIQRLCSGAT